MPKHFFDDSHIQWQTLAGFDHLQYSILDIDEHNKIIDALFKFAAHKQIVLHRHIALNKLFVIQGEHRIYTAEGSLRKYGQPAVTPTACPATNRTGRAAVTIWMPSFFSAFAAAAMISTRFLTTN